MDQKELQRKTNKEVALYIKEVISNPLWAEYYKLRTEVVDNMTIQAVRDPQENKHKRGEIHGRLCELHELKAFVLTHTRTDDDTDETSSKTQ